MIQEYVKEGKSYFKVREFARSKIDPTIRKEKSKSNIEGKSIAQKWSKKLLREVHQEVLLEERHGLPWGQAVQEWELAVREGSVFVRSLSPDTLADYLRIMTKHTQLWFNISVNQIDKAEAWTLLEKVERTISISRRKRLRTAIDAVFKWGILTKKFRGVTHLPTEGYKTVHKEEEKTPEILNLSEICTLLDYAKRTNHPWHPIWSVALLTGMRSGELFALEWAKIDFDNSVITVDRNWTSKVGFGPTKGRYGRFVPMNDQLQVLLMQLKVKSHNKFVLPRFQDWKDGRQAGVLREFCVGAGIPSVKFHTLRSCFATQLIRDGVAPAVVMKICGWKDLKTMQRYIRLAGIEIKGATEGLKLFSEKEAMGRVVELFQGKNEGV